jgi:hypothetical protein
MSLCRPSAKTTKKLQTKARSRKTPLNADGTPTLGDHLGCRDRGHLERFLAAGARARLASPRRCVGINRTGPLAGCRCSMLAMTGITKCVKHATLLEKIEADEVRVPILLQRAESSWAEESRQAKVKLAAVEKRRLQHLWIYVDPRASGSTLPALTDEEEEICCQWLKARGYDLKALGRYSGESVTARCLDRSIHAALKFCLKQNISESRALAKVAAAHRADAKFYERLRKADAPRNG